MSVRLLCNFATAGLDPADASGAGVLRTETTSCSRPRWVRRTRTQINAAFERIAARVVAAREPYFTSTPLRPARQAPRTAMVGPRAVLLRALIHGVPRYRTSGPDEFVRAVCRAADHVCATFGPDGIQSVCGHPEIEPALVELSRVTGERRYLEQARLFVERRGQQTLADIAYGRSYFSDDLPVRDADVLRGHAVRAVYLSAGATDCWGRQRRDLLEASAAWDPR